MDYIPRYQERDSHGQAYHTDYGGHHKMRRLGYGQGENINYNPALELEPDYDHTLESELPSHHSLHPDVMVKNRSNTGPEERSLSFKQLLNQAMLKTLATKPGSSDTNILRASLNERHSEGSGMKTHGDEEFFGNEEQVAGSSIDDRLSSHTVNDNFILRTKAAPVPNRFAYVNPIVVQDDYPTTPEIIIHNHLPSPRPTRNDVIAARSPLTSSRRDRKQRSDYDVTSGTTFHSRDVETSSGNAVDDNRAFRNELAALLRQRKKGRKTSKHRILENYFVANDAARSLDDTIDGVYNNNNSRGHGQHRGHHSHHHLFENIKLQKEIIGKIRLQPWRMRQKLETRRLAKAYVEKYEGRLSRSRGYQEAGAKYWRRFKREFTNFVSFLIPWEMRMKKIESHFGSVVASYFAFLRWLFWVNLLLTLITIGFIVLPEALAGDPFGSTPRKTIPANEQERALNLQSILDFEGYLKYSLLFYGYYGDKEVVGNGYRLPLAYFLAGAATYAISFVIILRRMAANSRLSKMSSKDETFTFNWKLFTTWDYMIGNAETAKNKAAEIITSFRESILEEKEKKKKQNLKIVIFLRVIANILVVLVLASSTYAIYLVVERSRDVEDRLDKGIPVSWYEQQEVNLVMSLITAIYPNLFDLIGMMEKYHPRINLRWQLARILVLYLMNLYTLIIALYQKIEYKKEALEIARYNNTITAACNYSDATFNVTVTSSNDMSINCTSATSPATDEKLICWETMVGQEIFKLSVTDTVITIGMIFLIDFVRGLFVRYMNPCWCWNLEKKFPEYGEFKIAENLLHLIYNQAIIWAGTFFAPMLPGMNLIKLVLMLYVRSWAVLMCNIPHERVFKASKSNNFYYAILLLMLFSVTCLVAFLLVTVQPSPDCGPFSNYEKSYYVFIETIEKISPLASMILSYVASPVVILPAFLLLLMAIYYLASLTRSLKEANRDLRNQLLYERTEEKRKIYAMAEAKREEREGVQNATQEVDRTNKLPRPNSNAKLQRRDLIPSTSQQEVEPLVRAGAARTSHNANHTVNVTHAPTVTKEEAAALKKRHPNIRILSRAEAERLNILPSQDFTRTHPQRTDYQTTPPVAVVHGNPTTTPAELHRRNMRQMEGKFRKHEMTNFI